MCLPRANVLLSWKKVKACVEALSVDCLPSPITLPARNASSISIGFMRYASSGSPCMILTFSAIVCPCESRVWNVPIAEWKNRGFGVVETRLSWAENLDIRHSIVTYQIPPRTWAAKSWRFGIKMVELKWSQQSYIRRVMLGGSSHVVPVAGGNGLVVPSLPHSGHVTKRFQTTCLGALTSYRLSLLSDLSSINSYKSSDLWTISPHTLSLLQIFDKVSCLHFFVVIQLYTDKIVISLCEVGISSYPL